MRINNNIQALNAYNNLSKNQFKSSRNLEKLSSGLRINRASDDAAGLAISEKMRGQIRGLSMAEKNTMDGISLLQTAEGALSSVHEMLQRMRELAVQAANDTYTLKDRREIQREINELASAINDVSENTQFNTKKLLDGSLNGNGNGTTLALQVGANEGQKVDIDINAMSTEFLGGFVKLGDSAVTFAAGNTINLTNLGIRYAPAFLAADQITVPLTGTFVYNNGDRIDDVVKAVQDAIDTASSTEAKLKELDIRVTLTNDNLFAFYSSDAIEFNPAPTALGVTTNAPSTKAGIDSLVIPDADTATRGGVLTHRDASIAIGIFDTTIMEVSTLRSKLGALQNRLEHTMNNLALARENLTAAESRIRDADMALEMTEFTRNNIINQAATAMLAQANQLPQGVLQLLQ